MARTVEDATLTKEFGSLIRKTRLRKKMTQERLSELTGITEVYLRDLEYGNYTATWVIWLKLCTVLDIDVMKFQKKYITPRLNQCEHKPADIQYNA